MKYNPLDECVGLYFKGKREKAKYSVRYVAERIGITKSTYFYYESGKVSMPVETLKKLLDLYNDDGNELFHNLQEAFSNYLLKMYAYVNGYEIKETISTPYEELIQK